MFKFVIKFLRSNFMIPNFIFKLLFLIEVDIITIFYEFLGSHNIRKLKNTNLRILNLSNRENQRQ